MVSSGYVNACDVAASGRSGSPLCLLIGNSDRILQIVECGFIFREQFEV